MRIVCVGGGPAGLYFAILAKLRDPGREVVVLERNPPGVTYGWGVVFSEDLLAELHRNDPVSAREIAASSTIWKDQQVRVHGRTLFLGGYGYSIGRQRLLDVLGERAATLGVEVRHRSNLTELDDAQPADLVVASDGVHSGVRELLGAGFRTSVTAGRDTFIWLGTPQRFDAFTFGFEQTAAGWVWFHAYSFDPQTSTFIVECAPETWKGLGFDELQPDESTAVLQRIFARHLDGQPLINQLSELGVTPWLTFTRIRNPRWVHGNLALMGDAAHTTHFSIGSGTTLAIQDSIALAQQLDSRPDLPSALAAYDRQRRAEMAAWHTAADNSARWYEQVDQHVAQSPVQFGYSMLRRRHGEQLPHEPLRWRYRVYLATQVRPLRAVRHLITAARRRRRVHARSE